MISFHATLHVPAWISNPSARNAFIPGRISSPAWMTAEIAVTDAGFPILVCPDGFSGVFKRIDMQHPAEQLGEPSAVHRFAVLLREDGTPRPELFPVGRFY